MRYALSIAKTLLPLLRYVFFSSHETFSPYLCYARTKNIPDIEISVFCLAYNCVKFIEKSIHGMLRQNVNAMRAQRTFRMLFHIIILPLQFVFISPAGRLNAIISFCIRVQSH